MFKDRQSEAIYHNARDLYESGLMKKSEFMEIEIFCMTKVEKLNGTEIAAIREKEGISQAYFAKFLNVTPKLISDWERGVRNPSGPSLKLLSLVKAKGLEAVL